MLFIYFFFLLAKIFIIHIVHILKVFVHIGAYFSIFVMHICFIFHFFLVYIIPVSSYHDVVVYGQR